MSRGPGRIEHMIEALFTSAPSRTFSTDELVEAVYRGVNRIEKKRRVGVLRAADKVGKRLGHWEKWQCERWGLGGYWNNRQNRSLVGRGAVYVNVLDVHSYAIGRLRTDHFHADKSVLELEAMLGPGGKEAGHNARGGVWWIHVEQAKVKRGIAVDEETE